MVDSKKPLPMPDKPLAEHDPELHAIIQNEKKRQYECLELIASENFTSKAVMECLGSCLTNKYSEGTVGKRYYGGNEYIDMVESLCQKRALAAFRLDAKEWFVNVQPLSGSPANFEVFTALLQPGDKLMGLALAHGGHLTHGHHSETKKLNASSIYFDAKNYYVNAETLLIDYDQLEKDVTEFQPKLLIAGASGYPRDFDFARFRKIADSVGAILMADIAHYSGLVATELMNDPFPHCHVVTSTTHKSLRGPRSGVIFCRKEFEDRINFAVFPSLQGGPHNHQIAALATQLKEVATPEFKIYSKQVIENARALAAGLIKRGEVVLTGGTDTHMVMWDVRPHDLTGSKVEKVLEAINMTVNKNSLVGDKSAVNPGGIRLGTGALTTRGFNEAEMDKVAEWCHQAIQISVRLQKAAGKKLVDFCNAMNEDEEVKKVCEEVKTFAREYSIPGI